jgi:hypothetical protein
MPVNVTVDIPTVRYTPFSTQIKPTVTADSSATWTTTDGSVSPGSGLTTLFTPPNKTKVVRVTGTIAGPSSDYVDIQVYATIPFQPNYGYELDFDNTTLRSPSEDGGSILRLKGPIKHSWQIGFNNVPADEWILIRNFYKYHQKHVAWYYEDLAVPDNDGSGESNMLALVTFDSGLKATIVGPQRYNLTVAIREV